MDFKLWIETDERWKSFGFMDDESESQPPPNPRDELPLKRVDSEYLMGLVGGLHLDSFAPRQPFENELHWGEGPGALRMKLLPNQGVAIERMFHDLEGSPSWQGKRFYQINRKGVGGEEQQIAEILKRSIEQLWEEPMQVPKKNVEDFPGLVFRIADAVNTTKRRIFGRERIRKINDGHFVIPFHLGNGNGAPNQQRYLRFLAEIVMLGDKGIIQINGYPLVGKEGRDAEYRVAPSQYSMSFLPDQGWEEIADVVASWFRHF